MPRMGGPTWSARSARPETTSPSTATCRPWGPATCWPSMTAGAYGAVQAGTYNTRLLVPEVLVRGDAYAVVRPRQTYQELIGLDRVPDWLA